MADQAAVKTTNGRAASLPVARGASPSNDRTQADGKFGPDASAVVTNVASFGENLFNLTELQGRMFATELRQDLNAGRTAGVAIAGGLSLCAAGMIVALLGIAELLVSEGGIKRGYALLITSAAAALVGGLCAALGKARLGRRWLTFPASGEELTRNLNWVRTVMRYSGRPPERR
jgi:hypothetical protein